MITREKFLMGRDKEYALTPDLEANTAKTLRCVNTLLKKYQDATGIVIDSVSSGYRPGRYNERAGGAKKSAHLSCEAMDIPDKDKKFYRWILDNVKVLVECELFMEDGRDTPTWVHLQVRPTKSGNRVFRK
jgi:hypothetical protein